MPRQTNKPIRQTSRLALPDAPKIAVVRANGLGDLLFTLPALDALRARYPQAEIVLLGKRWSQQFFTARPGPINRVVVVPRYPGVSAPANASLSADENAEVEAFFAAMQAEHFDLALQLHGGGRHSNPFTLRLGVRLTAGLRTPDAAPLDRWIAYDYYQPEILRQLEVVGLLDAPPVIIQPYVTLLASDIAEALHVVPQTGRLLVALHPGASDPRRRWPVEKFAAVGDALVEMLDAQVVICGDMGECELTQAVAQAMRRPALDLGGKLSLGGLAGLLARCRLLVANDSGPRHLAAAVGTRTVGIYWCGNMLIAGPPTHAKHRTVISWKTTCPECGVNLMDERRPVCGHSGSIVADIGVGDVLDAAAELLSEAGYLQIGASA